MTLNITFIQNFNHFSSPLIQKIKGLFTNQKTKIILFKILDNALITKYIIFIVSYF